MPQSLELEKFLALFGDEPMLPDIVASGSDRSDWVALAEELEGQGFACAGMRDFAIDLEESRTVSVEPVLGVIVNFFDSSEIVGDFDLAEMTSQANVDAVCDVIRAIGRATERTVLVMLEGMPESQPVLRYFPRTDLFEAVERVT